jgi:hypothetical protein
MAIVLTVYHIMSRILRRKKRGPVRAKKKVVDGIEFKSGLEAYMYKALKEAGIQAEYIYASSPDLNSIPSTTFFLALTGPRFLRRNIRDMIW